MDIDQVSWLALGCVFLRPLEAGAELAACAVFQSFYPSYTVRGGRAGSGLDGLCCGCEGRLVNKFRSDRGLAGQRNLVFLPF